jgi:hypothetical protein
MPRTPRPLIGPGQIIQTYTAAEARELALRWLSVFGRQCQGIDTKSYLWHIFSAGRHPCLSGTAAQQQYQQQQGKAFLVLANDRQHALLTDLRPETCRYTDYYVFPPNLTWTMAFTHEEGWLGPYFAWHPELTASTRRGSQPR